MIMQYEEMKEARQSKNRKNQTEEYRSTSMKEPRNEILVVESRPYKRIKNPQSEEQEAPWNLDV